MKRVLIIIIIAVFVLVTFFILLNKNHTTKGNKKMADKSSVYVKLDQPEITEFLFHARPEGFSPTPHESVTKLDIKVEEDVVIGANFFHHSKTSPVILFFHGNGEIVSDYNDLAPLFLQIGVNFLPVDYRGYGRSTGRPSVSSMMGDSHKIFKYVKQWLKENSYTGPFIIMGRSLGSASALELASLYNDEIDGLIIESGFAYVIPLLKLLGIDTDRFNIKDDGFSNIDKIRKFSGNTLVIHAEYDHIIPFSDGEKLFKASTAKNKQFVKIPDANHNTIFQYGINEYMKAIKNLADSVR